jgi:thiol-disulfide isomerase/thioredoxin
MLSVPAFVVALATAAAPAPRGEVLDFSATWCGPCQQMSPLVARLEREGLPIRKVDVDEERPLANRFNVTAMPTFVLVIDGKEVDRNIGPMSEQQLRSWIQRIPTLQDSLADGKVVPTSGTAAPFVADPNVRLGQPQPIAGAFSSPTAAAQPAAASRSNPVAASPVAYNAPASAPPVLRANDSPLAPQTAAPVARQGDPMAASVRLRVTIDGQINLGSGTIIESVPGVARIVTCGHIFRGFNESSRIEVNLFQGQQEQSVLGELVRFDIEADVGLIQVPSQQVLPTVAVARALQAPREQESVLSIGCSGGQLPTAQEISVTAVNPYLGPENLECTGVPVQGRSGGGLFRSAGELVGVCIAADPDRQRGVYAGLLAVHNLLRDSGLAHLYEPAPAAATPPQASAVAAAQPAPVPATASSPAADNTLLSALTGNGSGGALFENTAPPVREPADAPRPTGTPIQIGGDAEDAEIVCIIRPRNQPDAASQVVIVHQASPKLLSYLRGEMGTSTTGNTLNGSLMSRAGGRLPRESTIPTASTAQRYEAHRPTRPAPLATHLSFSQPRHTLQPTALSARKYVRTRPAAVVAP